MAVDDVLFKAENAIDDGRLHGTEYARDGKAVLKGVLNLRFDRGKYVHPRGPVQKDDIVVLCGKKQKSDKMGRACKELRDLIGLMTHLECGVDSKILEKVEAEIRKEHGLVDKEISEETGLDLEVVKEAIRCLEQEEIIEPVGFRDGWLISEYVEFK